MNGSSNIDLVERIESIKAGSLAALAIAVAFSLTTLSNSVLAQQFKPLSGLQATNLNMPLLVSGAIATLAGFLFGVTYRYVIREDRNPHLKSGAVLAFGLVRGLAQIDVGLNLQGTLLPFIVLAVESILLFAIARLVLDLAIQQVWIKPFRSK